MKIAIIGAGMAGLACAEALGAGGASVTLFDKGRRPGGRMSTRTSETPRGAAGFDYGAQYMSARDPAFQARIERWARDGLAARWPEAGDEAWVGVPGMSAPVAAMAAACDVRWSARVASVSRRNGCWDLTGERVDAGGFDALVVAVPAEQVAGLVAGFDSQAAALAAATPSQPCWTVMAAFDARLPVEAAIVEKRGAIGWAARDSAKPGRSGAEAWVIQAAPDWSAEHLEDERDAVVPALMRAFAEEIGIAVPVPLFVAAHRWRYARCGSAEADHLWNGSQKLGVCGDWLIGPRVEAAWLSGTRLAAAMR